MAIPIRRVQEVKTLSSVLGCGVHSHERHVRQFQLGALELERTRRGREKQAALRRIKDIEARLVEVDALIRKHHEELGVTSAGAPAGGQAPARAGEATGATRRVLRYGG
ncbi:MAG: hypothetical protein HY906_20025 [Deltaproteobacteria bacterium]|nr:hypothetical protein [Deltaproteobacteria bacterium]